MPRLTDVCPHVVCLLLLFGFLNATANSVHAQGGTATLSGVVTDQTGAVIQGVNIAVISMAQGFQRTTTTNGEGIFVVPLLPPGNYTVKAEHEGFTPAERREVILNVNDQRTIKISLNVGSVSQMVDVLDSPSLINDSPAVDTTVDRQFVSNLPLNGRSFQSLIALSPGVVVTQATSFNRGQFSVNGQRANANYFTVDGVSANIGANSSDGISQDFAGSLPGLNTFGGTNSLVSVDALEEFKIQTSTFAPEFGRTPGGQVQILTRSGTNAFHGTLFEYFRNDALDAKDWFVNANRLRKPALRQNDFGFVLGGPVLFPRFGEGGPLVGYNGRNKTFFFLSYEGLRLRQPQTENRVILATRIRQSAPAALQPVLNALPLPTGAEIGTTGQAPYAASFSNPSTLNAISFRVDHKFGDRVTIFGRYDHAPSETITRTLTTLNKSSLKTQTLTLGMTHVLSAQSNNEVRFNYSRVRGQSLSDLDNFNGAVPFDESLVIPSPGLYQRSLVNVSMGVLGQLLLGINNNNFQRQINVIDNYSYQFGNHQFKTGIDYRRLAPIYNPRDYSQTAIFANTTAITTGRASTAATFAIKSSRPIFDNVSLYGQDTWRPTRSLTLTYGLRWDVNPPPSEADGNLPFALTGVNSRTTLALAPRGEPLFDTTYNNFAPRVGVAIHPFRQRADLTIRGGFGVFYDLGNGQTGEAFTRYPFATRIVGTPNLVYPLSPAQAALPTFNPPPPFNINGYDPELKLPYTLQWNTAVDYPLGQNQVFSATYVGAAGRRLLRTQIMSNPNSTFAQVNYTNNGATSDYHAMQLQFERRLARGLQATASYTWAHAIDEVSDEQISTLGVNNVVRGNADFDIRHNFSAAVTYELPTPKANAFTKAVFGQWATDVIVRAQSAAPFSITSGTEVDALGRSVQRRVNVTPGMPIWLEDSLTPGGRRLNNSVDPARPNCRGPFCPAPAGQQGNLGRNALRGFPLQQVDFALRRQFNFNEQVHLQFRAEAFNLFNHPNFGLPESSLTSAQFGRATRTLASSLSSLGIGLSPLYQIGGPRSIQFAVRLGF
ncbi:MAG TPA: TonB-dependent receptor [Pyrinomonadaceae bacterium]|nr:TonB-dependent receptor [Pyrinomonadaceae bacterium]